MELSVLQEWKQDMYTEKNIWFSKLLVSAYIGTRVSPKAVETDSKIEDRVLLKQHQEELF